jgi:hypothetical protein
MCQVNDVRDRFQAAQLIQKIFRGHFVRASPRSVVKRAQVLRKARVTGKLLLLKGTKRDLSLLFAVILAIVNIRTAGHPT